MLVYMDYIHKKGSRTGKEGILLQNNAGWVLEFRTPTPFMAIAIASFSADFREQRLREFAKFWVHHSIDGIWMLPKIVTSFVKHKKTIDGSRKLEHIRELTFFYFSEISVLFPILSPREMKAATTLHSFPSF